MATVSVSAPFGGGINMDGLRISDLLSATITRADDTGFVLNSHSLAFGLDGSGFTYNGTAFTGGTVSSLTWTVQAATMSTLSIGGLAVPATSFNGWLQSQDTQAAFSSILSGNDSISLSSGNNLLRGYGGNDTMSAGTGSDSLYGGAGDDVLTAHNGLATSHDVLRGDDGNDQITGGASFEDINGNKGDDTIDGGSGGADWLVGGQGNDLISAQASGNILYGNLGDDTLHGGSGAEILRGGQADDVITGGGGNDWLSGDRGDDTIAGGAGADTFHTFNGAGLDRVTDFSVAEGDGVQLDPGTNYAVSQIGADTVIDLGSGDKMVLVGVQLSTLPSGWIFGA